jgi:hypothetical protein
MDRIFSNLVAIFVLLSVACSGNSPSKSSSKPSKRRQDSSVRDAGEDAASKGVEADGGDAAVSVDAGNAVDDASSPAAADSGAARADTVVNDPGAVDRGPYFAAHTWKGYLWIAHHGDETTLTATNFGAEKFDGPVCIHGSVAATKDSSASAMLGVNVNQAHKLDATLLTVVPTQAGVRVSVMNKASSPLRIQIQSLDGATNDKARWCANVVGSGDFVPWTQFNTACWDGSGNPYRKEPLSAVMLLVPGSTDAAVPYDFCLADLREADAPPTTEPEMDADGGV